MRRVPQASMERPSSSTSGWYWLMQENFLYRASFFSSWQFSRYFPLAGMAHGSSTGISGHPRLHQRRSRFGGRSQKRLIEFLHSDTLADPPVRHPPTTSSGTCSVAAKLLLRLVSSRLCLYLVFAVGRKTRVILPAAVWLLSLALSRGADGTREGRWWGSKGRGGEE